MLKRAFDFTFSMVLILILSPVLIFISVWIVFDSRGGVIYIQQRAGKNNEDFSIYKFRTMHTGADKKGLLTVGMKDNRITKAGYFLRKYKLDELPQLFNVLIGNMSFVGPRPEVRKYVLLYTTAQLKVLSVKPGITDYASILYANENEVLASSADPEREYINTIMPAKLELNLKYINEQSFFTDIKILFQTVTKIFF